MEPMKSLFQLYIQQFKTTFATMFQYRASLVIWMIGQVLEPLVYLIVWSTVSNGNGGSIGSYTTGAFVSYFIILMLVNQFTYTWVMFDYEYRIREGYLSFALLKPVHPIHSDIADNIMSKSITLPVLTVIAIILGLAFHARLSVSPWLAVLFVPGLLLAFALRFLLEWTLAQFAFWTTRVSAINQIYFFLLLFLSGQIAPLSILPRAVQIAAKILPFYWTIGFPTELLLGKITITGALIGLGVQVVWLAIAVFLVRLVWRLGVKAYSAVGQ
jgi:ABC-2 type transport system permease protein